MQSRPTNIIAVDVFLERRKSRLYVGRLERQPSASLSTKFRFTYDKNYLNTENAIPLGPELPLTQSEFGSDELFPVFRDRIPSIENAAFPEYLEKYQLSPTEDDSFVLLSTIGSSGPSSFMFEPVYKETDEIEDIKTFRNELGITIRDFATLFDISIASIHRMETLKGSGPEVAKRIDIYRKFPEVAIDEVQRNASKVHAKVKEQVLSILKTKAGLLRVDEIQNWAEKSKARFEAVLDKDYSLKRTIQPHPFTKGYWQACFVLLQIPKIDSLSQFRDLLEKSQAHLTGWSIGWVPTNNPEILPYPYEYGIEVWLGKRDHYDPGHSDFWRAEPSGRFALFRGYQEDGNDYPKRPEEKVFDFGVALWRVAEFLIYLHNFSKNMGVVHSPAILQWTWTGLEDRVMKSTESSVMYNETSRCYQDSVITRFAIPDCNNIPEHLLAYVNSISKPLFESFDFFTIKPELVRHMLSKLLSRLPGGSSKVAT